VAGRPYRQQTLTWQTVSACTRRQCLSKPPYVFKNEWVGTSL
jgi:hypothetical protein